MGPAPPSALEFNIHRPTSLKLNYIALSKRTDIMSISTRVSTKLVNIFLRFIITTLTYVTRLCARLLLFRRAINDSLVIIRITNAKC